MRKIFRYTSIVAAVLCSAALAAQNLDPTVEISRAYEGRIAEACKPSREMTIPDSVSTFRLDFDYSVFEKPYKGAYDFNPYLMNMRPSAAAYDPQTFYLKAGAGYRLYPELDMVWSPKLKNGVNLDVYAMHKSYVGDYRNIGISEISAGKYGLDWDGKTRWKGYDLMSKAGADLQYNWKTGLIGFNADYYGLAGKTADGSRSFNALDVNFSMISNKDAYRNFVYDLTVDYRFGEDRMHYSEMLTLREHLGSLNLTLSPVFKHGHKMMFDFGADLALYGSAFELSTGRIHFSPRYLLKKGRWTVDAGVRLDVEFTTDSQQFVYPDVKVGFAAIKDALNIYTTIVGGTKMNTYSSILEDNHHFSLAYVDLGESFFESDVERVKASLGFRGRITSRFSYDLRGGYASYANALLPAVTRIGLAPAIRYGEYQKAFAAFDWHFDEEAFKFDGTVEYTHSWDFDRALMSFAPAMLTGNVAFEYNWRRRIFAGVDCGFSSSRKMIAAPLVGDVVIKVPGYADLGLSAQYVMNRKLSFWLRGGNLCCMTIQRTPLYAEGGISFIAGICVNL